jgi:hypothetical protein
MSFLSVLALTPVFMKARRDAIAKALAKEATLPALGLAEIGLDDPASNRETAALTA